MPALAFAMTLAAASAQAQTYDPNYPICLQTFGRNGNAISCGYTSMGQCRLSAIRPARPNASPTHTSRDRIRAEPGGDRGGADNGTIRPGAFAACD